MFHFKLQLFRFYFSQFAVSCPSRRISINVVIYNDEVGEDGGGSGLGDNNSIPAQMKEACFWRGAGDYGLYGACRVC